MVQVAMLVTGFAVGLAAKSWRQVLTSTVLVWAVTLAVQTPVVVSANDLETASDHLIYWPIQVVSLLVALGIARFLLSRRQRGALAGR